MNTKRIKRDKHKKHLNYLIDCDLSQINDSKTDKMRSKVFQLNANKDVFTSKKAFDDKRSQLMNQLNEELDRSDQKNTFLSEDLIEWSSEGRTDRPFADFKSNLYALNEQQMCQQLGLRNDVQDVDDCQVVSIVLNDSEDIQIINDFDDNKRKSSSSAVNRKPPKVVYNCGQNLPNNNLLKRLGSYESGFPEPKNTPKKTSNTSSGAVKSLNCSPNRVSGIFKSNNSPKTKNRVETTEEMPQKRKFISGLEKKMIEDVKNGSVDLSAARNIIKQIKSFKAPLKESAQNNIHSANQEESEVDPNLKNIEKHLIEAIESEIITRLDPIEWEDVAGLGFAKEKIKEIAIYPLLKPHLFKGLRSPAKGILLFGPPGTGKTFLGRLVASQTKSTFFSITVSALNSKWIGEGEKTIRAMFAVARSRQPSVIFIDEIDSLLKSRSDSEHEASRRMKTEFLSQSDGLVTSSDDRILIIGATNRPQDLDNAALRRLTARLYIPLPDLTARQQMIKNHLKNESHSLTEQQIQTLAEKTEGYSGADMRELCRESAMEGIRDLKGVLDESDPQIRDITFKDFKNNLNKVKPTVRQEDLEMYVKWDLEFGTNKSK